MSRGVDGINSPAPRPRSAAAASMAPPRGLRAMLVLRSGPALLARRTSGGDRHGRPCTGRLAGRRPHCGTDRDIGRLRRPLRRRSPIQESPEAGMGQQGWRAAGDRGDAGDLLEDGHRPGGHYPLAGAGSGPGGQLGLSWSMRTGSGMMIRTWSADGAGVAGVLRACRTSGAGSPLPSLGGTLVTGTSTGSVSRPVAPADSPGTGRARGHR